MIKTERYCPPFGATTENDLVMENAGLSPNSSTILIIGGKAVGFSDENSAFRAFSRSNKAVGADIVHLPRPELPQTLHEVA